MSKKGQWWDTKLVFDKKKEVWVFTMRLVDKPKGRPKKSYVFFEQAAIDKRNNLIADLSQLKPIRLDLFTIPDKILWETGSGDVLQQ